MSHELYTILLLLMTLGIIFLPLAITFVVRDLPERVDPNAPPYDPYSDIGTG